MNYKMDRAVCHFSGPGDIPQTYTIVTLQTSGRRRLPCFTRTEKLLISQAFRTINTFKLSLEMWGWEESINVHSKNNLFSLQRTTPIKKKKKKGRGLSVHISHKQKSIKNGICGHVQRNNEGTCSLPEKLFKRKIRQDSSRKAKRLGSNGEVAAFCRDWVRTRQDAVCLSHLDLPWLEREPIVPPAS